MEIEKAVEAADVVIVCLSNTSVSKEGYIQREFKFALDIALEKPEGSDLYCSVTTRRLRTASATSLVALRGLFSCQRSESSISAFVKVFEVRFSELRSKEVEFKKAQPETVRGRC